jgi:CHU_C Type IX secretion signal domain
MLRRLKLLVFSLALLSLTHTPIWATHLRAGEITVNRLSCTSLTFQITVTVYIDTESGIQFGGPSEILNFGDSTWIEVPETTTIPRPDLGENMGMAVYTTTHTYSGPGTYVIRYTEPNRNEAVVNIANSVQTLFYLETQISIDPFLGCNNSPRLLVPPIDGACTGSMWVHNPGAFDPDGDSLSYALSYPKKGKGTSADNYRDPNDPEFYVGLDYNHSNEEGFGPPTFTINPKTGAIRWDAPGLAGEYNIAFLIIEWRKIEGVWVKMGYVVRDMQIIVEDCDNQRPELEIPQDICVEAGEEITIDIFGWDPDSDDVKIEAFSQVFEINPNPATTTPSPFEFLPSSPSNKAWLTFTWKTDCEHIRELPYQVEFKITDRPDQGPRLAQFETWNIRVVGPAPKWEEGEVNLGTRSATVKWESYACSNAEIMQVWRRVDQFAFTPPECVTGMPEFLGFEKITELPISQVQYVDTNNGKGLAVGAQYCYRLVAVFPLPKGGESHVSQDICLEPILADAPVITNVTIDKTGITDGRVTIQWRSPFDLNKSQFPPPYSYEVYRAEGFSGNVKLTASPIHPGKLSDSTYTDTNVNSEEIIYNYRVVLYDANNIRVDTSVTASTVRLETKPEIDRIELTWNADVPWSNQTQTYPRHLIYRGTANATENQLTLIDSVDVGQYKFSYTDSGQYQSTALKTNETYCYRIMTRGAYGNPKIVEPLKNFSQIMCTQLDDEKPPCVPVLNVTGVNCEEAIKNTACGTQVFTNTLKWNRPPDEACRADIRSYSVYVANQVGDEFTLYAENVRDTFFTDSNENLKSFARCYKVRAVDRAGNESELSEEFCFDNCPYYELPNVFTPNDDNCNEKFSAYGDPERSPNCGAIDDPGKCARFVLDVDFVVYNRWGKEVYRLPQGKERSIYIRWNGRDSDGKELSAGVYYYKADVYFNTVDPAKERKEMKGWVHLLRTTTPN